MLHPGNRDGPTQPHRRPRLQEHAYAIRTRNAPDCLALDERTSACRRRSERPHWSPALLARSLQRRRALPRAPSPVSPMPPTGPATAGIGHAVRAPYPTNAPSLAAAANCVSHVFLRPVHNGHSERSRWRRRRHPGRRMRSAPGHRGARLHAAAGAGVPRVLPRACRTCRRTGHLSGARRIGTGVGHRSRGARGVHAPRALVDHHGSRAAWARAARAPDRASTRVLIPARSASPASCFRRSAAAPRRAEHRCVTAARSAPSIRRSAARAIQQSEIDPYGHGWCASQGHCSSSSSRSEARSLRDCPGRKRASQLPRGRGA